MAKTTVTAPPEPAVFDPHGPPSPNGEPEAPAEADDGLELPAPDDADILQLATATYAAWTWWIYRVREPDEMRDGQKRNRLILCTKVTGPLDVIAIQRDYGGGTFDVWGFHKSKLKLRRNFDVAGPRKVWTDMREAEASPPASAPPGGDTGAQLLAARMDSIERSLERIASAPAAAAAGLTIADFLKLMPLMQPAQPSIDASALLTQMIGIFKMGAEVRSDADAPPTPVVGIILDRLLPAVERLAGAVIARNNNIVRPVLPAGPTMPQQQKAAASLSRAEVVADPLPANPPGYVGQPPGPVGDPPAPAPGLGAETLEQIRFTALVDALARAIDEGDNPKDFASTVERMLNDSELEQLTGTPLELLMPQLVATKETYPVFGTDVARPFVDAVLSELKAS